MKNFLRLKHISCLALLILASSFRYGYAQSGISAIDILLEPDQIMLDSAKVYNGRMRQNYSGPGSYSLDALHTPHITVLQCFVKTADFDKVYAVVAKVVEREKPTKANLTAKGLYYFPYKNLGLAGITIEPEPLLKFQSAVIEALKPFIVVGTNADFVQNSNGDPIAAGSDTYVNQFIPDHSGPKYNPHVTIGLAEEAYLKDLLAKPFDKYHFKASAVSVYQLGDFGTARTKRWSSTKKRNA